VLAERPFILPDVLVVALRRGFDSHRLLQESR
jgi:hypothetical protein